MCAVSTSQKFILLYFMTV